MDRAGLNEIVFQLKAEHACIVALRPKYNRSPHPFGGKALRVERFVERVRNPPLRQQRA